MPDEQKPATPEAGDTQGKEAPQKSVNDVIAEMRAENEKINKRLKDQEEFINRQASEIGELRKKTGSETQPEGKDDLVESLVAELKAEGLDEETARYNAKILAKSSSRVLDKRLNERMMNEVVDLVDEAMDEGKIDRKLFEENEKSIMDDFKGRKVAPTARKNYKILRECYDIAIKRKAESLRKENEQKDAEAKQKAAAEGAIPPVGPKGTPGVDDDKAVLESIRGAGKPRSSVFF